MFIFKGIEVMGRVIGNWNLLFWFNTADLISLEFFTVLGLKLSF
jgi:hypothetical protein